MKFFVFSIRVVNSLVNLWKTLEIANIIKTGEFLFWNSLDTKEIENLKNSGLDSKSLLFYGEIYFFLLNLKPCVFFSNLNERVSKEYLEKVIKPSNLLNLKNVELLTIKLQSENYSSDKEMILVNNDTKFQKELSKLKQETFMKESELATLLDYPTSLPEELEMIKLINHQLEYSICEVAYFHESDLLMSYGIRSNEIEKAKTHFQRYSKESKLNLKFEILML
jgi:hypothetical protein